MGKTYPCLYIRGRAVIQLDNEHHLKFHLTCQDDKLVYHIMSYVVLTLLDVLHCFIFILACTRALYQGMITNKLYVNVNYMIEEECMQSYHVKENQYLLSSASFCS